MLQLLSNLAVVTYTTTTTPQTASGPGAGFWVAYFIWIAAWYVFGGYVVGRVFRKAGRPMWAAFVPLYNDWVMLELGGQNGANIFWLFLPLVGPIIFLVFYIKAMLELARRFGKSTVFSIFGLILFSIVGFIILAFDKSVYRDPNGESQGPAGPTGFAPVAPVAPAAPVAPQAPATFTQPVETPAQTPGEQPPQQPPVAPVV